jgi:hypothetical protein
MATPTPDRATQDETTVDPAGDAGDRPATAGSGRRSRVPWLVGGALLAIGILGIAAVTVGDDLIPEPTPPPRPPAFTVGERQPGYLVSVDELRQRASLAAEGRAPYAEAIDELVTWARDAVVREPTPQEPLDIDGTEGPFVDDTAAAYGLGLSYVVTGDRAYAEAARDHIMAWVGTTKTTVDACPDLGRCQTALIISRTAPGFVFAADLIEDADVMTAADSAALDEWLRTVILPTASRLKNNWGDAGAFTAFVISDRLGDRDGVVAALERWRVQTDRIAADGHIPEETRRGTAGIMYTQESLQYRVAVATIAERYGLDLWSFRGDGGSTILDAIDYLASYWPRPEQWPWASGPRLPSTGPFWEIVYARYPKPEYVPIVENRRPFGAEGHSAVRWTTLTNGVPVEE